jgi:hypothetical protein
VPLRLRDEVQALLRTRLIVNYQSTCCRQIDHGMKKLAAPFRCECHLICDGCTVGGSVLLLMTQGAQGDHRTTSY